jgi:REP element-mobilizing transposase RayT
METTRIQEGAALYYLTFTVVHWLPVFVAAEPCLIVTKSLNHCHLQKSLRINAFVIMPTHMHLLAFDAEFDNKRLARTINEMRQYTGRRLTDYCRQHMPAVYRQVIGGSSRQDRDNQFWQQSRHPVAIWTEAFWRTKIDYLHDNPRRKGLVNEVTGWRFSSASHWFGDMTKATDVTLSSVAWR